MSNDLMKIDEAVEYLKMRGVKISRRSLYGWVKVGCRGAKLQHSTVPNVHPTAKDPFVIAISAKQIEDFLTAVGVRWCR